MWVGGEFDEQVKEKLVKKANLGKTPNLRQQRILQFFQPTESRFETSDGIRFC